MNIDKALIFKTKLININNMIKRIKELGFNIDNVEKSLEQILIEVDNNINISKSKRFSGLIETDYISAITKLDKIELYLNQYDIYFKTINFSNYILNTELNKNIFENIKDELINVLGGIRNSSVEDYRDEKIIIEKIYKAVYKLIKFEIVEYGNSDIFDIISRYDIDKIFIHQLVMEELNGIDITKYNEIEKLIYYINKEGLKSNYCNLELIRAILFKDSREQLVEITKKKVESSISNLNNSTIECNNLIKQNNELEEIRVSLLSRKNDYKYDFIKNLSAVILSITIPVGSFLGMIGLMKKFNDAKKYMVTTTTYNSCLDSTEEQSLYKAVDDSTLSEGQKVVVHKYTPFDDRDLRQKETYDLSFLDYENLEDYIYYVENNCEFEPIVTTQGKNQILDPIVSKIDYYEVVKSTINTNDYIKDTDSYFLWILLFIVIEIIIIAIEHGFIEAMYYGFANLLDDLQNSLIDYSRKNHELKENKEKILSLTKNLLNKIGENKELKRIFNEEIAKHPEIIDSLDYELVKLNNNTKVLKYDKKGSDISYE